MGSCSLALYASMIQDRQLRASGCWEGHHQSGVLPLIAMQTVTAYLPHFLEDSQVFPQMKNWKLHSVRGFARAAQVAMGLESKTSAFESLDPRCYFVLSISN